MAAADCDPALLISPWICMQICPACSEVFLDETSLSKHLLDSHKSSMHECSLCPKKFSSESGLKYHLKSKHFMNTQPPEINVKQDFCGQEETSNHFGLLTTSG